MGVHTKPLMLVLLLTKLLETHAAVGTRPVYLLSSSTHYKCDVATLVALCTPLHYTHSNWHGVRQFYARNFHTQ